MPDVMPFQHRERIFERFATAGSSRDIGQHRPGSRPSYFEPEKGMNLPNSLGVKAFDPNDYDCHDVSQAHHFVDRVGDSVRYLADYNAWIVDDEKTRRIDDFVLVHDLFDRACVATSLRRG
jgi:hypothetical protein